jgi:hypothetical protein
MPTANSGLALLTPYSSGISEGEMAATCAALTQEKEKKKIDKKKDFIQDSRTPPTETRSLLNKIFYPPPQ